MIKSFLLVISFFVFVNACIAQKTEDIKTDSTKIYKSIEEFSKRSKLSKALYGIVFKSNKPPSRKKKPTRLVQRYYHDYEGKIIRNISITTLDPFGYSVKDTAIIPEGFLKRAGNDLHIKTLHIAVKNLLLFKRNDVFDSLKIKESERLIRSQRYVREVFLYPVSLKKSDSVDIIIRVLDLWTIVPNVGISTQKVAIRLTEKNFLGTGHQFENYFAWNHTTGNRTFSTYYNIPTIKNTYINTSLRYYIDDYNNFIKSISVERKFYSPLAKWAGGVFIGQEFLRRDSIVSDTVIHHQVFKYNTQDYWVAREWQLFKGNTEAERTTNLIYSLRYLKVNYLQSPDEFIEQTNFYHDYDFYFSGIGITKRTYFQDQYIFNFGVTEDVPVGNAYGIVGGYRVKNNMGWWYVGVRAGGGKYVPRGYLSSNLQIGSFITSNHLQEGTCLGSIIYFSNLIKIGNWRLRQFIKPEATIGLNRNDLQRLTINDNDGLRGFNSASLFGYSRLLLTLQTQSYAPWNLIGFRFGPYFVSSFAMLADPHSGFKNSRLYSLFGIGLLIKNDFLVLNTFQVSVVYYPVIPGSGNNLLKINPYRTTDFVLPDFEISKPGTVPYQ